MAKPWPPSTCSEPQSPGSRGSRVQEWVGGPLVVLSRWDVGPFGRARLWQLAQPGKASYVVIGLETLPEKGFSPSIT